MSEDFARRDPLTPVTEDQGGEESRAGGPVPRYRILGLIGTGGMGVVYRAEDTRLGRTVALKFLPPMLTPNPWAKTRFLNEARAASALDHTNICTVYEVGETAEGQLYLAMPCYDGETLRQRLERGPLTVAEALRIALQAARGLAKAHGHGIVHRDIKPANLMINADGVVKILDFGVARLPDQTLSGPPLGTPGYMSPEQARLGTADARTDIWSLGIVLREMLTGYRPGYGGFGEAPHGEEPAVPLLPREAPPGLDGILTRMLAAEPEDRYPDAAALLADLSALEGAVAVAEGKPSSGPVRRRLPAWAALLGVAVLAFAAGFWLPPGVLQGRARPDSGQIDVELLTDPSGKEWFPSLSPDGNLFVYAKKVGDRSRLFLQQVGGGRAMDLPSSPEGDSQPAISPDGHRIAFRSERDGGGIFVMGLMGESVRRVTDFGFNPAWSPDGGEIVFATARVYDPRVRRHPSQIYRVSLEAGPPRLVQRDGVQPSWSPHGFRIAYWERSPSGERVIWTVPADGGEAVQVTQGESIDWNPVWSPDGRHLYFASDRSGVTNLWRVPIDERSGKVLGEAEPVTNSGQESMLFSLSRDGRRIVYTSDETRTALEKVAFDPASGAAGPAVTVTDTGGKIRTLDASRDGRWLVYQTFLPEEDLFIIRPDGSGRRWLTDDEHLDRHPRWSPDGTRIAFYSNRGGDKYEIWTVRADGSGLERVEGIPGREAHHPIWSPDGRWLAFHAEENEALVDLTRPVPERRAELLPSPGEGKGFSASSWSPDGRWLAGALHSTDGPHLPGVVLYSVTGRRYVRITERGEGPTWLSDSRRLLYWDDGKIFLLDTVSRASRQVLATPPGSDYNDFSVSADDRTLYLVRDTEQGGIWLLTLR
jgi:Tol biopolymer transport system component